DGDRERLKEVVAHRAIDGAGVLLVAAFDVDETLSRESKGNEVVCGDVPNPGNRAIRFHQRVPIGKSSSGIAREARSGERDLGRRDVGVEPKAAAEQRAEAADEKPRADEEKQGQRDLADYQRRSSQPASAARRRSPAGREHIAKRRARRT